MSESTRYDLVVVGGGLAGSATARHAAAGGLKVLLLERTRHVGTPVRCGEAAGAAPLDACVDVPEHWISTRVSGVRMVSPSGTKVDIDDMSSGYILKRDVMDKELVDMAVAAGVQYRDGEPIVEVARDESGGYTCVSSTGARFAGTCLALADGVESRLARQLGWDTTLALEDLCSCAFCHVTHDSIPEKKFEMYYGTTYAPGGYAWVFPRGDGSANVGLGILGKRSSAGKARECLDAFVSKRFGGTPARDHHCAGVSVAKWIRPLARDGAVLVGDAARMVDAMSGGGITYAMEAGELAGRTIVDAFAGGQFQPKKLAAYERAWAKNQGKVLNRVYALKQMVIGLDDATLDKIAHKLAGQKTGKLGLVSVAFSAFASRPWLLLKALMVYR